MSRIALVIESDSSSPPGYIGNAAEERGFELHRIQVEGRADSFEKAPNADIVIVTGSVEHWYDLDSSPHLRAELAFLERAIERSTPILGLCFGGQGLALALGGEVKPLGYTEIGWHRLETSEPNLVPPGPWFEWHGDGFGLAVGADLVAWNEAGNQAFRHGPHLGLQFHPEVDHATLSIWLDHAVDAHVDRTALMVETEERAAAAAVRAAALFDGFLEL